MIKLAKQAILQIGALEQFQLLRSWPVERRKKIYWNVFIQNISVYEI